MKKQNLKSLKLNKKSISKLDADIKGGAISDDTSNTGDRKSADVRDCPDNTLLVGCMSLGHCPYSFWVICA